MSDPNPYEPTEEGETNQTSPRSAARQWIVAAIVAVVIVVSGFFGMRTLGSSNTAGATNSTGVTTNDASGSGSVRGSDSAQNQSRATGKVTAVEGSTMTIESTDGSGSVNSTRITTNDDTVFTESVEGTVSDLSVGDNVVVMGTTTDGAQTDGSLIERAVTARRIIDSGDMEASEQMPGGHGMGAPPNGSDGQPPSDGSGTPPADFQPPAGVDGEAPADWQPPTDGSIPADGQSGQPPQAPTDETRPVGRITTGQIKALDGSVLTVTTADGSTVKVDITDDTSITITRRIKRSAIKVGDTISASGTKDGEVLAATTVRRGDIGFGGPGIGGPDAGGPSVGDPRTAPGSGQGGQAPSNPDAGSDTTTTTSVERS